MTQEQDLLNLLSIAIQVRNLQSQYLEFKDKYVLIEIKRKERLLDEMLYMLRTKYNMPETNTKYTQNKLDM